MNSKTVGERSEAMVLAALLQANKTVLQPFGDNQRYDLVVEENGKFSRIQVKTGRISNGAVRVDTCSSYTHRGGGKKGYRGEADFFAVYCPDNGKIYMIPVEEAPSTTLAFRLEPSKNGQKARVRMAVDYEFIAR